jgi:hypothetical protein
MAALKLNPLFQETDCDIEHPSLPLMQEDSEIDELILLFLRQETNGLLLKVDTVAHIDFFYNTLLLSHETINPLNMP